jgi:putative hemolysin
VLDGHDLLAHRSLDASDRPCWRGASGAVCLREHSDDSSPTAQGAQAPVTLLPWLVIAFLVAVNALYVSAEFAAVAVQRSQLAVLARGGNRRATRLLSALEDGTQLDRYIAACQIGITLSSLVAGAYGQASIAPELGPLLERRLGLAPSAAEAAAFVVVLLVLTVVQVVLGELVPKTLALQFPERMALLTYPPTRWSVSLYRGLIWLLNGSGFLLLKPFGITPRGHQHVHSPEELELLFAESHRGGALSPEAHRRLRRGLQLSTRSVSQLMTPRREIYAVEASAPPAEVLQRILSSPYGHLPVYRQSLDHILGAVSTKDVVALFASRSEMPLLEKLLRPLPFVPGTLPAHRFVRFLQERHSSQAIVVDEFGGVQGIVSIEDLLGELFGELGDELKQPDPGPEMLPDGSIRLPGSMALHEAEPWLAQRWEGAASTIGGHLVARLGRLPEAGERMEVDGVRLTVTEMLPTGVRWILVQPKQGSEGPSDEPNGEQVS